MNKIEQYSRRENVIFKNIPKKITNRILEVHIIKILKSIGLNNITSYDIAACHRLANFSRDKPPDVIVRFVCRKNAIKCLKLKRYLSESYKEVYIAENLSSANMEILLECKELKNNGRIHNVWTRKGIVFFVKTEDPEEYPSAILHIDDLIDHFKDYYDESLND